MAKVNPPIAQLSTLNLPKPLLDFLNQLWIRSGGLEDFIETLDYTSSAEDSRKFVELRQLTKKVNQLDLKVEELRTENQLLRKQLSPKQGEEVALHSAIKKIESRLNDLELS